MKNTIFISSTFKDFQSHRVKVWELLTYYKVNIRGMEKFGARTEAPLATCLAEVEQSDIFIGIIGYRLGKVDLESSKSFVQLEYEKALSLGKEILIYLQKGIADTAFIDFREKYEKLEIFKSILKERHTIDTFNGEDDLIEKLKRKFDESLLKKEATTPELDEYKKSNDLLQKFLLLPAVYSSKEVKLKIKFESEPFPASKAACKSFSLSYGSTIGIRIKLLEPNIKKSEAFKYLFININHIERFFNIDLKKEIEIYASLLFTPDAIDHIRGYFTSETYAYINSMNILPSSGLFETRTIEAEGQIILMLKDFVS